MTRPESLRAQIQLGDDSELRALAETLNWQQRALLALNHPAAVRSSRQAVRETESP